ncbi:MAG TPA: acyl-CoA dehydrogenase [Saprospiraceae bacterium]|nr:acyl-CoA dehydrogenase [Saprospiraceae bacterium]
MADYLSMEHLKFCLFDVQGFNDLLQYPYFSEYDEESANLLLDGVKDWADTEAYPYFREMDENPVTYHEGKIKVHPQIGKIMSDAARNGWIGAVFDYEHGGLQMPHMLVSSLYHIIESANNHMNGYVGLTSGAADLIRTFGSRDLFDLFVPPMMEGKWGGTMCLTEPQAGSSLSDITTTAYKQKDGKFKVKGQKIFISGGDHQFCENFVHLTLVRIEGAPPGTKGISLMVIPKYRWNEAGNLIYNDVYTAGDFQKLGQRGYATTHLVFGEQNDCYGWLVGSENMGLPYMFQMMNGARIDVGLTAASTASAAYYASLQYAMERPQGRKLSRDGKKNPEEEQTLIINHPDVRRMLLFQKSVIEGSLSLLLECTRYADLAHVAEGQEKEDALDLLEFLTPIAKTYPSEKGIDAVSQGIQVLGGYGYTMDFPLQQYYRDIRIMTLYEGTTGIQSLDLLGRKMTLKNGRLVLLMIEKVSATLREAKTYDDLKPYAAILSEKLNDIEAVMNHLLPFARKGNFERFLADATIFMEMVSTVIIAYQWLKMAVKAKECLITGNMRYSSDFYESKIHTMKYFFKYEVPRVDSCKMTILNPEELTLPLSEQKVFI